ncbi:MAG: SAF domain-containing protein [Arcanobacterium sp.]|nr:SAF domain-containing protein [Arcanobacterium sp.]
MSFGHAIITTLAPAEKTFAEIIIAKKDLAAGTKITEEHISLSKVEPNSEIAEENLYTKSSELIGETLAAPIPRGLAITKTQILSNNFISLAPQGTVISAVNISQELSTELLEPGQYIDLYAPATLLSNNIENITQAESVTEAKLLGENILIIGKFKTQEKSPMFGEVANNTVLYLAIPEDTASVVLGVQAKTPLQAVVRKK